MAVLHQQNMTVSPKTLSLTFDLAAVFKNIPFYFLNHVHMCVFAGGFVHVSAGALGDQKRVSDTQGTE